MKIGAKVVCIRKSYSPDSRYRDGKLPEYGKVYVIEKLIGDPQRPPHLLGLRLVGGYTSFGAECGTEVGLDSRDFRLLDEVQKENALVLAKTTQDARPLWMPPEP